MTAAAPAPEHPPCPFCQSVERDYGYGLAAGPMAAYAFCRNCDQLVFIKPDLDGLSAEDAARVTAVANNWHIKTYGQPQA